MSTAQLGEVNSPEFPAPCASLAPKRQEQPTGMETSPSPPNLFLYDLSVREFGGGKKARAQEWCSIRRAVTHCSVCTALGVYKKLTLNLHVQVSPVTRLQQQDLGNGVHTNSISPCCQEKGKNFPFPSYLSNPSL